METKKFCEHCTSRGVRHKKNCTRPIAQEKTSFQVSREEFESLKNSIFVKLDEIATGLVKKSEEKSEGKILTHAESPTMNGNFLPENVKKIVDKYFDMNDGFHAWMTFPEQDEQGHEKGGITFTIDVPLNLSTASQAHKAFYKKDIRMKAISPTNMLGDIEGYCKLVVQELRYDKNAMRK